MIYTLENDSLKVQVNSHGGELWSIQTKDGAEYLWQGDETYWKRPRIESVSVYRASD